jgi:hypothetical protein
MIRIYQLTFLIFLFAASTARALTPPTAVPDATRVRTMTTRSIYPNIRLAVPAGQRSWNQIAHGFTADLQSSILNTQRATPKTSIRFTPNLGQIADTEGRTRPEILYTADAEGVRLFFTAQGVSHLFSRTERTQTPVSEATGRPLLEDAEPDSEPTVTTVYRMDMIFEGSNPFARVHAEDVQQGYTNYYYAHCPDGITHVKSYGKIVYENIYENIDLIYYTSLGRMKYEFVVRPGGKPSDIRLRYSGTTDIALDVSGGLTVCTPLGSVREEAPYSYQDNRMIESSFALDGDAMCFAVGEYDVSQPLVIDPWATYCGGSGGDYFLDVSAAPNGNLSAGGTTASLNFPVQSAFQSTLAGAHDAMMVQYSSAGILQWATYYGGTLEEGAACSTAMDGSGNSFLLFNTRSTNLPVSSGCHQSSFGGDLDMALVKFTSAGLRIWATYLGGSSYDEGRSIATDASGNAVYGGCTRSTNFPVLNAAQGTAPSGGAHNDAFVGKFSGSGQLQWCTYLGGSNQNDVAYGVAVGTDGSVAVTGKTDCTNFPTLNAFQSTAAGGGGDAFLTKYSSTGTVLWSTYYGGSDNDYAYDVGVDGSNNVIFVGRTESTNFPIIGALQSVYGGNTDGYVVKMSATGVRVWSSYLGGNGWDRCEGVAVNSGGNVYITVTTVSSNMPIQNAHQSSYAGGNFDAFVLALTGNCALLWGSYYGGVDADYASGITLGSNGDVIFCGYEDGGMLPTVNAQQPQSGGSRDGWVVSLSSSGQMSGSSGQIQTSALSSSVFCAGEAVQVSFTSTSTFISLHRATLECNRLLLRAGRDRHAHSDAAGTDPLRHSANHAARQRLSHPRRREQSADERLR